MHSRFKRTIIFIQTKYRAVLKNLLEAFIVKKKMDTPKHYVIVCSFSAITKSVNEYKYNFSYYSYKERRA